MGQHAVRLHHRRQRGRRRRAESTGCSTRWSPSTACTKTSQVVLSKMDEFGGPKASNEYPVGFAWAMMHPVPVHQAVRQPLRRHPQPDDPHLARAASPTTAACDLSSTTSSTSRPPCSKPPASPPPTSSTAWPQKPSTAPAWPTPSTTPHAADRRTTQYFEIMGTAASITRAGSPAPITARSSGSRAQLPAFSDDRWELYDLTHDYSQADRSGHRAPGKARRTKGAVRRGGREELGVPPRRPRPRSRHQRPPHHYGRSDLDRAWCRALSACPRTSSAAPSTGPIRSPRKSSPRGRHHRGRPARRGRLLRRTVALRPRGPPTFTYNYFGSTYTTIAGTEPLPAGEPPFASNSTTTVTVSAKAAWPGS